MHNIRNLLPSLDCLISFEAAARLESFTAAANELHVTQAAVSQQIRMLENSLGVKLFDRAHRAVHLTTIGKEYQHTVSIALTHLANATREIKHIDNGAKLTIATDQSIASMWLMPRLFRFNQLHADVTVRIVSSDCINDCLNETNDIIVLHGDGNWKDYDATLLFCEEIFPVCSESYLAKHPKFKKPGQLTDQVLLDLENSHWNWTNWRTWLTEKGINLSAKQHHFFINSYPLVIEAAKNGQGIALGWRYLIDDELKKGKLIRPIKDSIKTDLGYYVLRNKNKLATIECNIFYDWIFQEYESSNLIN